MTSKSQDRYNFLLLISSLTAWLFFEGVIYTQHIIAHCGGNGAGVVPCTGAQSQYLAYAPKISLLVIIVVALFVRTRLTPRFHNIAPCILVIIPILTMCILSLGNITT